MDTFQTILMDLMIFLKKIFHIKDSKKDLSMLPVALIIINTPKSKFKIKNIKLEAFSPFFNSYLLIVIVLFSFVLFLFYNNCLEVAIRYTSI